VAFTVTITTGSTNGGSRVEHPDADTVAIEDGHLVLRAHRVIVGIYAPGRWHSVTEERLTRGAGRRVATYHEVPA
jgi:hypothetical protein